jgi:kynurenine formamidase
MLSILPAIGLALVSAPTTVAPAEVAASPWGPNDELGAMNLQTHETRSEILNRLSPGRVYDLSVDYFIGMPSWHGVGDPRYQYWLTHSPRGTVIDDPMNVGREVNEHVSYTGDAVSMYTHMGTHIDALNHFGLNGKIYNGFAADDHLGDRGWTRAGAETIPPIVARGVMIDVPASKSLPMLPDNYRITAQDLKDALRKQQLTLRSGDVVLIRTGRMALYEKGQAFIDNSPGLGGDAARFLAEEGKAMIVGADNLSFEAFPSENKADYVPVHTYLLAQKGVPIIELAFLEELSRDKVYEFAFFGGSLRLRGASAAPMRPIAIPLTD